MPDLIILKRAAEQKLSMNAQYLVGLMSLYGQDTQGTGQDINAAREWFAKAAAQKHTLAEIRLARLAAPQPEEDTPERLQHAAGQGDSHAQYDLAQMHYYGWAVKPDFAQCAHWAQQAAAQHCPYAQYLLSGLYFDGKRVQEAYPYALYLLDEQHFDEQCIEKSYKQAFAWMLKSAEQGYVHAQNFLGDVMYNSGIGVKRDAAKAFEWVHKAAQQGYAEAQHALGLLHYHGTGCEQSNALAKKWYHKAAAQGHAKATGRIGDLYRVYDNNNRQAFIWVSKAAELGDAAAQLELAQMLEYADDIPHDHAKACYWLQKAAEQGWSTAPTRLAEHYAQGHGVAHDEAKAAYWYLYAAKLGDDQAQYQIGLRYEKGRGIEKDFKQAEYWYRLGAKQKQYDCKRKVDSIRTTKRYLKAAQKGEADAETLCRLGEHLAAGVGCAEDEAQARHWYLAAAELGNARAAYHLGQRYEDGQGVEKDQTQALAWYQKAAELGYEDAQTKLDKLDAAAQLEAALQRNDPDAHYQRALDYQFGLGNLQKDNEKALAHYLAAAEKGHPDATFGVAEIHLRMNDYAQALTWCQKAAQLGDDHALYAIGMFYDSSTGEDWGVAKDDKQAAHWYEEAAQRGHITAQFQLAKRYSEGQGIPQDDTKALYWYEKATEQKGIAKMQSMLGDWYAQGRGTAKDESKAMYWYKKAAEQGDDKAGRKLKDIQARLALAGSGEDEIEIQYRLGLDYDYGRGVERDFVKAVQHYRSAAERGHADAQFEMGNMCAFAQGTEHNQPEALHWYIKAALQGHEGAQEQIRGIQKIHKIAEAAVQGDTDAQCELAYNYYYGHDALAIKKDAGIAFAWYLKAATGGHAEAQYIVSRWYEEGEHITKDPDSALYWLQQSAELGYKAAIERLQKADMSTPLRKAAELGYKAAIERLQKADMSTPLRKAAEAGDIDAMCRLGELHYRGRGVEYSHSKAAHWYEKAAELGHIDAMYQLGLIYHDGLSDMPRDIDKALEWFTKAAAQHHALAAGFITITRYNQAIGSYDKPRPADSKPPVPPISASTTPASPLWYSAEQIPLIEKALAAKPPAMPAPIRAIQQKALDTAIRCAEKLSGAFADRHVELVKLGMRALRKEADDYDAPDEFTLEAPMFEELSEELRKVRKAEGALALHCMVDRSKYKIYETDMDNNFAITVHCDKYANLNWMDDRYSDKTHPAVFKGSPTAAEKGFDNDSVPGGEDNTWTAAAPLRNSQGKIVAIIEAHLRAPELRDHRQWNASTAGGG